MKKDTEFDEFADQYDLSMPNHIVRYYLTKRVAFVKALGLSESEIVLDIGCGTGYLASHLIDQGFKVIGIDTSMGMLQVAKRRLTKKVLVQGTAESLPVKSNSFDLVVSVALLHHLTYKAVVANTIREMVRVVRPGGRIIIWDHNPMNPYWPIIMKKVPQDAGRTRLVPLKEIIDYLQRCDKVQQIEIYKSGWVPEFIPKNMMFLVKIIAAILEQMPIVRCFSAHNVVVAQKR